MPLYTHPSNGQVSHTGSVIPVHVRKPSKRQALACLETLEKSLNPATQQDLQIPLEILRRYISM